MMDESGHTPWCSPSFATAQLMKLRGVEHFATGLPRTLFLTFMGYDVVSSITQGFISLVTEDIFTIETPSKATTSASQPALEDTRSSVKTPSFEESRAVDCSSGLFMLGAKTAGFRHKCLVFEMSSEPREAKKDDLIRECNSLKRDLHLWRSRMLPAFEGRSERKSWQSSPYRMVQVYIHYTIAYNLCFYAGFILLLRRSITKCF